MEGDKRVKRNAVLGGVTSIVRELGNSAQSDASDGRSITRVINASFG